MNQQRAQWAETALRAFCEQTGQTIEDDGFDTVVYDFLCDLMHLTDRHNVRFEHLLERATDHYEYEVQCICKKCLKGFDAEADATKELDVCLDCEEKD